MTRHDPKNLQVSIPVVKNRYALRALIGFGGYGVVYSAIDLAGGGDVAVKFLDPTGKDQVHLQAAGLAMQREESVRVHHPNIAAPIDGGVESGFQFVVSPMAPGETIQAALGSGWLPTNEDIANILFQSLDGLAVCHILGIIHRDLSAKNVMVDRAAGRVTIIDFGGVYLQGDPSQRDEQHFHATPGIIPPEMLASHSPEPTPSQDLFGIGVLGYELITGLSPFEDATPEETNNAVRLGQFQPIAQIMPHAHPQLVEVIERLMAHDPRNRYTQAVEAMSDLMGPLAQPQAAASVPSTSINTPANQNWGICTAVERARCSGCGQKAKRPSCSSCGLVFVPDVVVNLWEGIATVHSTYFIAEGEYAFGRDQVDPQDRSISRRQMMVSAGLGRIVLKDGGSCNPTDLHGVQADGSARPGTTLFSFSKFTGHLVRA